MDLSNLATALGLRIIERRDVHHSGYLPGDDSIYLTPGMRGRVLRSVLAHEIGHHILGHRPTNFGPTRKRQEHAANAWAAEQLIRPESYAEAERLRDGHAPSMAFDLNVSDELLLVYRRSLLRTERAVYVRPRMGSGGWAHRIEVG